MEDHPHHRPGLEGNDVICIASANWEAELWTNSQHLMHRLAKHNRVLFVESLGLRRPSARWRDIYRIFGRVMNWIRGVRSVSSNLHVYSPIVLPLYNRSWARKFNLWLLRWTLGRAKRRLGFRDPILWAFLPTASDLVGQFGERICIYHCVDEYGANPGVPARVIQQLERDLLGKANVVFTTSKGLYESKRPYNPNTFYLPNVADYDHFRKAADKATVVPEDIATLDSPVIGFVGAVSGYKIDFDLLHYMASEQPDWSIVLIGPVWAGDKQASLDRLSSMSNVHLLGARRYEDLPGYLKGFDVCMIPFELNETTMNVFPMKFHEYMATGKPVVVVNLPSVMEFSQYCRMADGPVAFVEAVGEALEDTAPVPGALAVARQNTWEARIGHIADIVRDTERNVPGVRPRPVKRGKIGIDVRKIHDFGIGTYIQNLVSNLSEIDPGRGYVLFENPGEESIGGRNFEHLVDRSPKYSIRELVTLPVHMHEAGIDLFHSPHYVLPVVRPCRAVVTIHDLIHLFYPPSAAAATYAKAMMFAATRSASKVITVSHASRDDIVRKLGVDPDRIVVIHNAIDDRFRPGDPGTAREELARRFGFDGAYLLCVSNSMPHKNIEGLLRAFRILKDNGYEGRLLIVGAELHSRPELAATVERLDLMECVRFLGFVEARFLPDLYLGADVFVFPSFYEGFGLPPLEAMGCGVPVVVSDTPSLNEVVGEAGIRVDPRSDADIAAGVRRLIEDGDLRAKCVHEGIRRASSFSWRVAAEETLRVYCEVMDG